jgi:hypothetical protein
MTDPDACIANAAWQFNEAVSLLREARNRWVPDDTTTATDIDEGWPAIDLALRDLAEMLAVPVSGGEPHTDTSTVPVVIESIERPIPGSRDAVPSAGGVIEQVGPLTVRTAPARPLSSGTATMSDPTHLAATRSDRGFLSMPPLADAFGPDALRILEASTADAAHIWLRVERPPEPDQSAVVMLTAEQAWQLKEQIEWLLEHHYQGDARPVAGHGGQPCPHIVTSDEGTSYCALAEHGPDEGTRP